MPAVTRVGLDSHVGHASPTPNPFHQTAYASGSPKLFVIQSKAFLPLFFSSAKSVAFFSALTSFFTSAIFCLASSPSLAVSATSMSA